MYENPRIKGFFKLLMASAIAAGALVAAAGEANASPYGHEPGYPGYADSHGRLSYDRNGDGVLSRRERLARRYDRDHDGFLDRFERRSMNRSLRYGYGYGYGVDRTPEHLDEHDEDGNGYLDRREMRSLGIHDRLEQVFRRQDRNRDGYLSWREARRSPIRRHFQAADHDHDRYLSWNELEHYLEEPAAHSRRWRAW